jgi:hypothetical protein
MMQGSCNSFFLALMFGPRQINDKRLFLCNALAELLNEQNL